MAKRPSKKALPSSQQSGAAAELRHALARRIKSELVDVLVELAQADRGILRLLITRFDVATSPDELIAATRQAIADATRFDKRDQNSNFSYDDQAYGEVKRNLDRLIALGQLVQALPLAMELMERGSYQVEMSDEGLMTEEIEDCLTVVLTALRTCDLPTAEVIAWCSAMLDADRVGFIASEPLQSLRSHHQATTSQ